jgi:hypothetical protein
MLLFSEGDKQSAGPSTSVAAWFENSYGKFDTKGEAEERGIGPLR